MLRLAYVVSVAVALVHSPIADGAEQRNLDSSAPVRELRPVEEGEPPRSENHLDLNSINKNLCILFTLIVIYTLSARPIFSSTFAFNYYYREQDIRHTSLYFVTRFLSNSVLQELFFFYTVPPLTSLPQLILIIVVLATTLTSYLLLIPYSISTDAEQRINFL
jgi:hypothetical protein